MSEYKLRIRWVKLSSGKKLRVVSIAALALLILMLPVAVITLQHTQQSEEHAAPSVYHLTTPAPTASVSATLVPSYPQMKTDH